jgi:hypothetical protein
MGDCERVNDKQEEWKFILRLSVSNLSRIKIYVQYVLKQIARHTFKVLQECAVGIGPECTIFFVYQIILSSYNSLHGEELQ